jgi:hypothetical protein
MYRIVPVSFYLDFSNHESTEEELKHFVQYYWECINQTEVLSQSGSPFIGKDKMSPSKARSVGLDEDFEVTLESPKKNKSELNNYEFLKKKEEIRSYYKSLVSSLKPLFNFQDMGSPKR